MDIRASVFVMFLHLNFQNICEISRVSFEFSRKLLQLIIWLFTVHDLVAAFEKFAKEIGNGGIFSVLLFFIIIGFELVDKEMACEDQFEKVAFIVLVNFLMFKGNLGFLSEPIEVVRILAIGLLYLVNSFERDELALIN